MALSPTLPTAHFSAESGPDERPSPAFAVARETSHRDQRVPREATRTDRARTAASRPLERRLILTLVAAAHLGAAIGFSQWRAEPLAPPPPPPISVALIEPPVVIPTPVPPPPAPTPPKAEVRKEPPRPKPVVKPAPPKPVKAPVAPAPAPATPPVATVPAQADAPPRVAETVPARFDAAYLNNPAPAYPPLARRMREEGKVLLRVFVTADGAAGKISVSTSSGSSRLDTAAENAVARWRFVPAKQDGRSVEAWVVVPIVFKLEG